MAAKAAHGPRSVVAGPLKRRQPRGDKSVDVTASSEFAQQQHALAGDGRLFASLILRAGAVVVSSSVRATGQRSAVCLSSGPGFTRVVLFAYKEASVNVHDEAEKSNFRLHRHRWPPGF